MTAPEISALIPIAPEAPLRYPHTIAEAAFYNQGVADLMRIAEASAKAIAATSKRHVHEAFAVAALIELAERARALLRYTSEGNEPARLPDFMPPSAPAGMAAE